MPLALYAARSVATVSFEEVLRAVIEAGGDTDTIASMTGQMGGAWLGVSQIPRELIDMLPHSTFIERVSDQFASALS